MVWYLTTIPSSPSMAKTSVEEKAGNGPTSSLCLSSRLSFSASPSGNRGASPCYSVGSVLQYYAPSAFSSPRGEKAKNERGELAEKAFFVALAVPFVLSVFV